MRDYIGFEDEDPKEIQRIKETLAAQSERELMTSKSILFLLDLTVPYTNKSCEHTASNYLMFLSCKSTYRVVAWGRNS